MSCYPRTVLPVLACLLLAGCATTGATGRSRVLAPSEIGAVYSEMEVKTKLAFTPDASCEPDCSAAEAFRDQIWRLVQRLVPEVHRLGAERNLEVPLFNVTVPAKDDIGTLSSAAGNIIVFDGLRQMGLAEPALAFLLAREMGHIIAHHHEENTATGLAVSVAIALIFPVAGLLQGVQAAYTASAAPFSVASSVASFAGSRAVRALYRGEQRREADTYALLILARAGWSAYEVAVALQDAAQRIGEEGWMGELRDSKLWLDQMTMGPQQMIATTTALEPVALPDLKAASVLDTAVAVPAAPAESVGRRDEPLFLPSPSSPAAEPPAVRRVPLPEKPSPPVKANMSGKPEAQGRAVRTCAMRLVRGVNKIVCTGPLKNKTVLEKTPPPVAKGALSRR